MPLASTRGRAGPVIIAVVSVTAVTVFGTTAQAESKTVIGGTQGPDRIVATNADEAIFAKAGDDWVRAAGGRDFVTGDAGDDALWGGSENDYLQGQLGHDFLHAGPGDDNLRLQGHDIAYGGPGDDRFYAEVGGGEMHGGDGIDDLYVGGGGHWLLRGGAGNDEMASESINVVRYHGGDGNDQITYAGGPGKAFAGAGDDSLTAYGASTASLHGGPGNDYIDAWSRTEDVDRPNSTVCGAGFDTVHLDPIEPVSADCETVWVIFTGTEGDDDIDGTPYNDEVIGYQGGVDSVRTHAGDDYVGLANQQDQAADTVDLGAGDDQLTAWQSPAIVTVECGPGNDTVRVDPDDVLADDCETLLHP